MGGTDSILPGGKGVWIPIDHGVSDYPVNGLENLENLITLLAENGADAIVAQKGVVSRFGHLHKGHMIAHLSVSTRHSGEHSSNKILVGSVEESLLRGANGVSVQVNLGSQYEPEMIERLGSVSEDANQHDLPLLGMIYPRGENLNLMPDDDTKGAAHAARLAFEMGCDVVKTIWTGDIHSFSKVCAAVPIPVLIAGGPAGAGTLQILETVYQAMQAGAGGVCMGRQVFSHESPGKMVKALKSIVHDGLDAEQALSHSGL
ncbi:MAG: 2-amino-3,7-dideoxy-D-threo-hept-6-ulosonate synthase [Candidatus Poseidoniaceae archaeon]|jgi:predicted phospho-2-dehydro-3-deoxyheptonate aldolase|nr:2-amino-3,7-dideoxy-D-threo-hept-6-ulosonate synthase [Candidatus Poseidoniaceae archaeon]